MLISFNTHTSMVDIFTNMGSNHKLQRVNRVSQEQYQQWRREYCFEALRGQRYGQSFCNHFGITDHRIFYDSDVARCDRLILSDWVDA